MFAPSQTIVDVPALQNGDHLTRSEFERRYEAAPENVQAQLIEGIVYMHTSVRFRSHANPHSIVTAWLTTYAVATPGVFVADNGSIRLDPDNEPQPDVMLLIDPVCGGQARIDEDDYVDGAPELIVEVAASSAAYDLHEKKTVYRRNRVQEYIVWQIHENRLDWFVLEDEQYLALEPDAAGLLRSRIFPGLHLAVDALREGDWSAVLEAARKGAATDEHNAFVERLKRRSKTE